MAPLIQASWSVLIYDGLAAHGGDGRGDIAEGNGLRPSESIASARVRVGVEKGLDRDRRDVDFAWRPIAVAGAEEGDVPHAGGLGLVQECGDLTGVPHAQRRSDQVDPVRPRESTRIRDRIVPVEEHVAAATGRGAGADTVLHEVPGDKRARPAAAAENERCLGVSGPPKSLRTGQWIPTW